VEAKFQIAVGIVSIMNSIVRMNILQITITASLALRCQQKRNLAKSRIIHQKTTTNGEMNMKMSDVFELPLFAKNHEVGSRCSIYEGRGVTVASSFYANQLQSYELICKAVNSHDRLTSENARLRDMLKRLTSHDNCRKDVIHLMSEADSLIQELEKGDE
jgi:hypothetical protein